VIVATVLTLPMLGGVNPSSPPAVVVLRRSPFAAVKSIVPVAVAVAMSTTSTMAAVKRPRCVAVPSYVPLDVNDVGGQVGGQLNSARLRPVNVPRNGSPAPTLACVWVVESRVTAVGDVGESRDGPLQAATPTHRLRTMALM
jgi:hypothetical protein